MENTRFTSLPSGLAAKPATSDSLHNSDTGDNNSPSLAGGPTLDQGHNDWDVAAATTIQNMTPLSDLNFEVIWPDSEDLFQTIMSSDASKMAAAAWNIVLSSRVLFIKEHLDWEP